MGEFAQLISNFYRNVLNRLYKIEFIAEIENFCGFILNPFFQLKIFLKAHRILREKTKTFFNT
jgi:hypothetical protein